MHEAAEDDGAGVGILTNKPMTRPPTLFYGPQPPTPLPPLPPPNDLLGEFAAAQRRASGTLPKWVDHKVERKHVWRRLGVPEAFIVPTLYSAHLVQSHAETPEFVDDGEGGFMPSLDSGAVVLSPDDPGCKERLRALLVEHGTLVVKPAVGANSKGVLLLATSASALSNKSEADLVNGAAKHSQQPQPPPQPPAVVENGWVDVDKRSRRKRPNSRNSETSSEGGSSRPGSALGNSSSSRPESRNSEPCVAGLNYSGAADESLRVWLGTPLKTWRSSKDVSSLPYDELYHECMLRNPLLRGDILVEPTIEHDQVCSSKQSKASSTTQPSHSLTFLPLSNTIRRYAASRLMVVSC